MTMKKILGSLALLAICSLFLATDLNAQTKSEPQKSQEKPPKSIKLIMGADETFSTHKPNNSEPEHYRVLSSGEMVPFNPYQKGISLNKEKKKRVHCVQVKCPASLKKDINCWKCKKMKARPKPKK